MRQDIKEFSDMEEELEFLRRYFYASREFIGHIRVGKVPEDDEERFFAPIVRLIDEYEHKYSAGRNILTHKEP